MKTITKNMLKLKEVNYAILPSGEAGGKNADEQLRDLKTKVNMETDNISVDPQAVNEIENPMTEEEMLKWTIGLMDCPPDPNDTENHEQWWKDREQLLDRYNQIKNESKILTKKEVQENKLSKIITKATIIEKKDFLLKENNEGFYQQLIDRMLSDEKYRLSSKFKNDFARVLKDDATNFLRTIVQLAKNERYSTDTHFWGSLLPTLKRWEKHGINPEQAKLWQDFAIEAFSHPEESEAKKYFDKIQSHRKNVKGNAQQQARGEASKQAMSGAIDKIEQEQEYLMDKLIKKANFNGGVGQDYLDNLLDFVKTSRMSPRQVTMLNRPDTKEGQIQLMIKKTLNDPNIDPVYKQTLEQSYQRMVQETGEEIEKNIQAKPVADSTNILGLGIKQNNIEMINTALKQGGNIDKQKIKNYIQAYHPNKQTISYLRAQGLLENRKIILNKEQIDLLKESLNSKIVTKEDLVNKLLSIL